LTFDYQHHRAWAVPDTAASQQPEWKYNYSGMKIKYSAPGKAIVSSVVEDSPAWSAGLRADDQVTAVDGQSISPDLVSSTNRRMSSGELKPVRLSIERDNTSVDIVVQPQDYIQ
jgi:C-terminal processing protease CtpA/Prc